MQTLAGVLLPSATVPLPLCNDKAVLGSWVNGRWTNLFTGSVIAALVMLSVVVAASVLFPSITVGTHLGPARLTAATRVWMIVLRGYLLAVGMVVVLALGD